VALANLRYINALNNNNNNNVASVKHYLNAIKAKHSALNARKSWSAVGNPTSALGLLGSSFGPSSLAPIGIHHLLLSNFTTVQYECADTVSVACIFAAERQVLAD